MSTQGYNRLSILIHWATVVAILALYFSHEGRRGSAMYAFHIGFGALAGVFLIARILRRVRRGMPEKSEQSVLLNRLSAWVIFGFSLAIVVTIVTGYILPWSRGAAIDVFGWFAIPSPIPSMHWLHEFSEEAHELAANAIMILLVIHVVGALKHAILDRDQVLQRMLKSVKEGK